MPMLAALGAAGNFAGCANCQDIVLNSVAIGFVFELDDFLYTTMLSRERRAEFEGAPPRSSSPLSARNRPHGPNMVTNWCWVCYLIDVGFASYYYFKLVSIKSVQDHISMQEFYAILRNYAFFRAAVMTAAQLQLTYVCEGAARRWPKARLAKYVSVTVALMVVLTTITYTAVYGLVLVRLMGAQALPILLDPTISGCMFVPGGNGCEQMHQQPGIMERFAKVIKEGDGSMSTLLTIQYMWGKADEYKLNETSGSVEGTR